MLGRARNAVLIHYKAILPFHAKLPQMHKLTAAVLPPERGLRENG
jgi:hypothetical protein